MGHERVLLIDDDEGLLHLLKVRLTAMGFQVVPCTTAEEALEEARNEIFDMAITDLRLAAQDGLDLMDELLLIHPTLPVLVLTAHGSIPNAVEAIQREPFVAINCGAIPESLFESELFGHARGAFTGAYESKRGLFQTADGGTLFFDEIGEMPLAMQGKLLRALQEREVHPVGTSRPVKVNARIIAASNKDLGQAVKKGTFREDLYYRIHVVPLTVPPLRERRADIPLLAQHFLKLNAQRMNKDVHGILPDAMQKLMLSPWRGNVRELENTIEKAVVMATQDMITADLIHYLDTALEGQLKPLTEAKADFEQGYLKEVLESTRGNISRAALIAGRYRADFYKLLRKYRLHPADAKAVEQENSEKIPGP